MSAPASLKTTPLHAEHVRLGAKMIGFGGWDMPVQYTGIVDEHQTVRSALGVFDISHMGQFFVTGGTAASWLNRMLTNNVERLSIGQGQYTLMLNDAAGVIDDLIIYRVCDQTWLLVVNAAKIDEDWAWLTSHLSSDVQLTNESETYGGLAIQGPKAGAWFETFFGSSIVAPARNGILRFERKNIPLYIARTGYTGEDGFELFFPAANATEVFQDVLEAGAAHGIKPAGLGARDTLRMEMCYPLNGNDLSPEHTPIEAGLGFFVDTAKQDFIGRGILSDQKASGPTTKLVAFKMVGATPPPRSHYGVFKNGEQIGETCSGGLSPSLKTGIGLAYLPAMHAQPGTEIEIDIRGRKFPAVIEKKPLYRPGKAA